jgi:hypothetical protein
MLNLNQLQFAVAAAKRQFDLIRKKYPALKAKDKEAYLVMSLPSGQTGIDSSPTQILSEFPAMVVDDGTPGPKYDEKTQVEIRFNDLKFDLVWKLQVDDLVDCNLTPQTKASIQIVLGTLAQFARTHYEK